MTVLWRFTPRAMERETQTYKDVLTWLEANGIDTHKVSPTHEITVEDVDGESLIRLHENARDEDGKLIVIEGKNEVLRVERLVPLASAPPGSDWRSADGSDPEDRPYSP